MERKVIAWFRNDLRLDDNESLLEAAKHGRVIPVYIFDPRLFKGKTKDFGFEKTAFHRARFIRESVISLRKQLEEIGSGLVVRVGRTEEEIAKLAESLQTAWVFCNRERTAEEVAVQDELESRLWNIGQELRFSRGKMLYHTADLPFPVSQTPDVFTQFRKEVERFVQVRQPYAKPSELPALPENIDLGQIPTLAELGYEEQADADPRAVLPFQGGEEEGLARLRHYLWDTDLAKTYKKTRNQLLGADFSTKFSPWLAAGCLSPKRIYHELRAYEAERGSNDSTYWIFFELLWRDFFRLMAKKHRNAIFLEPGPKGTIPGKWSENRRIFDLWASAKTGIPFIDANMRELNQTGFMSNRGRQNVASFLVKDLKINWQLGAEYFESLLIDYDVASNWCNWNYVAGVGSDPRENRYFNILTQAERYDPQGEYVKHWLPELKDVPADRIHRPDTWSSDEQAKFGVRLGVDYPNPMIEIRKWAKGARKTRGASRQSNARRRGRQGATPQFDF